MKLLWLPVENWGSFAAYEFGSDCTKKLWHVGQSAAKSPYRIWEWDERRKRFKRHEDWFWDCADAKKHVDKLAARRKATIEDAQPVELDQRA